MKNKKHNERCSDCKKSVESLLIATFETVESNYDINLPAKIEGYINSNIYEELKIIHQKISGYRNFNNFVKVNKLPRVDFFAPKEKIIIEFDESQHFTKPREIALSHYSNQKKYGYNTERWRRLCFELDKKDNDPPYRDEQRAWYDTLRDFAPFFWGKGSTIRLYPHDLVWCSLDSTNETDLNTFKEILFNCNKT